MPVSSEEAFFQTARTAETLAATHPGRYRLRLFLFALLGYLVIFAVFFALSGLVGGLVGIALYSTALFILLIKTKLLLVVIPTAWVLLKSVWVRLEPPEGKVLKLKHAPVLRQTLRRLRKRLKHPRIHQIILTPELNASVTQTPRLGVLGWPRNTLALGLQLLLLLSPTEAEAVLAHEFGHLSHAHGRFGNWIYRVRITWLRIMEGFDHQGGWSAALMRRFFDWYAPRFAAYSFAFARASEYQADTTAATLTEKEAIGQALVKTHIGDHYLAIHYWEPFIKQADTLPEPPHGPWRALEQFLNENPPSPEITEELLNQALTLQTDYADTHPSLKDRLQALEVPPQTATFGGTHSAGRTWLGMALDAIIYEMDQQWLEANRPRWRERYEYCRESLDTLAQLNQQPHEQLSDEDLWKKAQLILEFQSDEAGLKAFNEYQKRHPDDPDAAFAIGTILFTRNDESFLEQMKLALGNPRLVQEACDLAIDYLRRQGRDDEIEWWQAQACRKEEIDRESELERSELTAKDTLIFPDVPESLLESLRENLADVHPKVEHIWVAQKPMRHYQDIPALAFAIGIKGWFHPNPEKVVEACLERLEQDDLGCTYFLVAKSGEFKALAKAIIKAGKQLF